MTQLLKHPELKNLLLFVSIAVFIAACSLKAEKIENPVPAEKFTGIPVDGIVVSPAVMHDHLEVTGSILANQQVKIVSELTRKVKAKGYKKPLWIITLN